MELSQEEIFRYSRHLLIPEVGVEGQQKLKNAAVLLVGSGGLGSPVALYLAAAGIGRIGIVDYDVVEFSNLQRQIIHGSSQVGALKVASARRRMMDLNPYVQVDVYNTVFSAENAWQISAGYDVIVDGTDNFPTRYLINDLCVLTGRPFVYGSIYRFEGQVSVFDARSGACYRCLFPEPPPPGMVPSCAEGGVFGVLPGTIGSIQATEVIKLVLGIGENLAGRLLLYDALDMSFQMVQLRKNPKCKICGANPEITQLIDYEAFCGVPTQRNQEDQLDEEWNITPAALAELMARGAPLQLVDVRDPVELHISHLAGAQVIPVGQIQERIHELDPQRDTVVFCRTGARSARALRLLVNAGFRKVKNLQGGINAWAREVDPSVRQY